MIMVLAYVAGLLTTETVIVESPLMEAFLKLVLLVYIW